MTIDHYYIYTADRTDCELLADIIVEASVPVAFWFSLTKDNCPKHPSNCTSDWIEKDFERGVIYYILKNHDTPIGCVALEKADDTICYLERLAVRPSHQKRGAGQSLVTHIIKMARNLEMKTISIGLIAADKYLKTWYTRQGFEPKSIKEFPHLPFKVQFMSLSL